MPGLPAYPRGDLDVPATLAGMLGTFWSEAYAGSDRVRALAGGIGRLAGWSFDRLGEAQDAAGIATAAPAGVDPWRLVPAAAAASPAPAAYGGGGSYGDGRAYGAAAAAAFALPLPADVVDVAAILDDPAAPAVAYVRGVDFAIARAPGGGRSAVFAADPAAPLGRPPAAWWLWRPRVDRGTLAGRYGLPLGLASPPTAAGAALTRAAWDAAVAGAARGRLEALLAAATGAPAAAGGEVVRAVGVESDGAGCVVTDRSAYRLPPGAAPAVAAGDAPPAGAPLSDAWALWEAGTAPVPAWLEALAAGPGDLLDPGLPGPVAFPAAATPLVVAADPLGRTRVSWSLAGRARDVAAFWDAVHRAGTRPGGTTLARRLDVRGPSAPTEPTAASLPATVSPLGFACDALRGGLVVARVRAAAVADAGAWALAQPLLRDATLPIAPLVVVLELPTAADALGLAGGDGPPPPGTLPPLSDTIVLAAAGAPAPRRAGCP